MCVAKLSAEHVQGGPQKVTHYQIIKNSKLH